LLFAVFQVLLHRFTGKLDLVVGTDVANRNRREVEGLIGFFVNQLVLRTDLAGDPSFEQLMDRVRAAALEAYSYQHVPFQKLVEILRPPRVEGRAPLFQVKLVLQNTPAERLALPGLTVAPAPVGQRIAKYDLTLFVEERSGCIGGTFEYHPDLFDPSTIECWRDGFVALLEQVATRPAERLCRLAVGLDAQRRRNPMLEKPRLRPRFSDFTSDLEAVVPQEISLAEESLIEAAPLSAGGDLPLRISPATDYVDLAEWAQTRREWINRQLDRHGALLFRGFGIDTPSVFEGFAGAVAGTLFDENGEHPRETVSGKVYTPVFFPPDKHLLWHNENSFNRSWPMKIFFACAKPAERGGETSVVDSRRVYRELPADLRRRFTAKGVMYVRNYGTGVGLDWRTVFGTNERSQVEARCREARMEFEWKSLDRLATRCVRPAVVAHPRTGETVWFNQAQHWHVSCLEPATRRSLESLLAPEDLPRNCFYGDGERIADEDMQAILDIYQRLEVVFPWQRGDVMLIDNVLTAHGRNPFVGERKILVALGEMRSFEEVA
jgi:alpha-ketoglutarate-dependent taurine dioxygenase